MPLPRQYAEQACSLARSLEIVGERWSLLILRDAFFGVTRFSDFAQHLGIPRAILTERLAFLVDENILRRGPGARPRYTMTAKGEALWPAVRALVSWGDEYYAPDGPRRIFRHSACGGDLSGDGRCTRCEATVAAREVTMLPGPGCASPAEGDRVSAVLAGPRPLLQPI
jgi:DNA-binding HxlR family transcriptional regulator